MVGWERTVMETTVSTRNYNSGMETVLIVLQSPETR
jgi:hypothetical protein